MIEGLNIWGVISAVLIAISWIINKTFLNGEYLGEMNIVSFFVPAVYIELKKYMEK